MVPRTSTRIPRRSRTIYPIHVHLPDVSVNHCHSSIPWHAASAFLIPVLLAVLQVHCQGSSPLRTHPANMWTFILCLLIYSLALMYYFKSHVSTPSATIYQKLSAKLSLISGSLASAALISVLVPRFLEPIVFIIWLMFLFIYFARNPILHKGKGFYISCQKAFSYVNRKWEQITGSRDDQANILRV